MPGGEIYDRRSIRFPGYDYANPGAYFITLVTDRRRLLFGEIVDRILHASPLGRIAEACWREIPDHFPQVELGAYVVMPNHVHGILILHDRAAIQSPPVGATHGSPLPVPEDPTRVAHTRRVPRARPRGPTPGSIGAIVGLYKMAVTRAARQFGSGQIWQRNYYEHIIRDEAEWNRLHLYVESNPGSWGTDEENPQVERG